MHPANKAADVAAAVLNVLATDGSATQSVCHVKWDNSEWAASVPLKTDSANSWCVDSKGTSRQITAGYLLGTITVCP